MDTALFSIFEKELLNELPLTYYFMTREVTARVGELYVDKKFGKSNKHYANEYICYESYKPISNTYNIENE
jgi:hypothetical protein